jgi:hypothetical protein
MVLRSESTGMFLCAITGLCSRRGVWFIYRGQNGNLGVKLAAHIRLLSRLSIHNTWNLVPKVGIHTELCELHSVNGTP